MDEKQGDSVFSLRLFMDKMDLQSLNNGRVVVESVERFSPGTSTMSNVKTYLFISFCSQSQSKLVSHSV